MNKKTLAPLIAVLMLFLAAGCSGPARDSSSNLDTTNPNVTESTSGSPFQSETSYSVITNDTETDFEESPSTDEVLTTSVKPTKTPQGKTSSTPAVTTVPPTSHTTPIKTTPSSPSAGGYKTIYNQLASNERSAYNELVKGIISQEKFIYLNSRINADSLYKVYEALLLTAGADEVYPPRQYKYSYSPSTGYVINVELAYDYNKSQIEQMNAKLERRVADIISKLSAYKTDMDKIKFFHDEIIANCSYSIDGEYSDNAYGALVDGKAVCEGYSRALLLLCKRAGINCILVTGYAGEEHMWNMVEISGKWYHIDLTWDDPSFDDGREDFISYTYFNLSDEMIKRDHTIDNSIFSVPRAISNEANYHVYNKLYVEDVSKALSVLENALETSVKENKNSVSLRMSSASVYELVKSEFFDSAWSGILGAIDKVNARVEDEILKSSIQIYRDDKQYVLRINFKSSAE